MNYVTLFLTLANNISEVCTKRIIKRLGFQNIIRPIFESKQLCRKNIIQIKISK